ncbi:MAG: hypothetical protein GF317_01565 [Candidatus Lokiarchaeota archaeon]|nr:hypothetical protein [Candidatus Lokiarchaeota archaeon]MBD3198632.1 hypothetical protein [Candidatus Lokiarchaeota archaeon]
MVHEENTKVSIKLQKDMIFQLEKTYKSLNTLLIDESLEEDKEKLGPDAASLLGMAVISCLSASFIFCLQKRNLSLDDLEANADISFKEPKKGYMRIDTINVNLKPKTKDSEVLKRMKQCIRELKSGHMFFEESCIITPSVREGINIHVNVNL